MLSVISQLDQRILILTTAALPLMQWLQGLFKVHIHALQQRTHLGCLSIVLGQMPQTASEDLFEVGHALVIICEYFVEQANRVVGSHHWGENYRYLLFLVCLVKMF